MARFMPVPNPASAKLAWAASNKPRDKGAAAETGQASSMPLMLFPLAGGEARLQHEYIRARGGLLVRCRGVSDLVPMTIYSRQLEKFSVPLLRTPYPWEESNCQCGPPRGSFLRGLAWIPAWLCDQSHITPSYPKPANSSPRNVFV